MPSKHTTRWVSLPHLFLISVPLVWQMHGLRAAFVKVLQEKFADYGLTYSIGGQISFDVFPNGWGKKFALGHVQGEGFEEIPFFGDKTYKVCDLVDSNLLSIDWIDIKML